MKDHNPSRFLSTGALLLLFCLYASAQKLPTVQKTSISAPVDIKIDGKTTEWKDKFQAYNNATDVFYILSNDANNIYLTVKAKDASVMDKIIRGGVSFTINHTLSKKDASPVVIIYPALKQADRNSMSILLNSRFGTNRIAGKFDNSPEALNNLLKTRSKFIKVTGIAEVPDEKLSIYNDKDILVAAKFVEPLAYVYELAVPLKFLNLPNNGANGFSYHIKLDPDFKSTATIVSHSNLPPPPSPEPKGVSVTDFWGEYVLTK